MERISRLVILARFALAACRGRHRHSSDRVARVPASPARRIAVPPAGQALVRWASSSERALGRTSARLCRVRLHLRPPNRQRYAWLAGWSSGDPRFLHQDGQGRSGRARLGALWRPTSRSPSGLPGTRGHSVRSTAPGWDVRPFGSPTRSDYDGPAQSPVQRLFVTSWYGTREESRAFIDALTRHCACEYGLRGVRQRTCGPHQMLAEDQRALDGLIFVRRLAERLRREEHSA